MTLRGFSFIIDKYATEVHYACCYTAMNREIAAQAGNFRGVCPIIGRLRRICTLRRSLRHEQLYRPYVSYVRRYFS